MVIFMSHLLSLYGTWYTETTEQKENEEIGNVFLPGDEPCIHLRPSRRVRWDYSKKKVPKSNHSINIGYWTRPATRRNCPQ
jgi:hypothetical protein